MGRTADFGHRESVGGAVGEVFTVTLVPLELASEAVALKLLVVLVPA